jgi:predicted metal-dependent peptidase
MDIKEKITKAKVQIQMKSSFFAYLSLYLKIKEDNKVETACINAKGEMYYNTKFFEELSELELQGVIIHEIFHLAFLNLTRLGTKDQEIWNYATDLVNNTMLVKESKYELPKGCVVADKDDKWKFKVDNKEYWIDDVSTKRADEIYYEIYKVREEQNGKGGKFSPNEKHKEIDKHDYGSLSKDEIKEIEQIWTDKMAEAVAISKMKGDCPAGIQKMFDELHKEEIDWKAVLQRIVTREIPYDHSFSKPHKKSYNYGVYMPDVIKESVEISIICDLSGSIGQEEFNTFFSEIVGMARAFQNRVDMTFYSHDTKAYNCGKIRNGNIEEIQKIKLIGGGGTSHKEVFDMLKEDKPKLAIFLTDGYSDIGEIEFDEYNFKKVFVITKGGSDEQIKGRAEVLHLTQ